MTNTLLGNNTTHVVDSVAQLKTLDVEPGNYVQTRSYYNDYLTTSTKASGGALYYITTVTAQRAKIGNPTWTPDGYGDFTLNNSNIAVLVPSILEIDGATLGLKADNSTDNSPILQSAFSYMANHSTGILRLPPGTILLASPVTYTFTSSKGITIQGQGIDSTVIKCNTGSSSIISLDGGTPVNTYFTLKDLTIDGGTRTTGRHGISFIDMAHFEVHSIRIIGCDRGINMDGALVCEVRSSYLQANFTGLYARDSAGFYGNHILLDRVKCESNTSWGIDVDGVQGLKLFVCDVESNGTAGDTSTGGIKTGTGMSAETGFCNISFDEVWMELNKGWSLYVQNDNGLTLAWNNSRIYTPESNRSAMLGTSANGIRKLTMSNILVPSTGDTVTVNAEEAVIESCQIATLTNNATYFTIAQVKTSAADGNTLNASRINTNSLRIKDSVSGSDINFDVQEGAFTPNLIGGTVAGTQAYVKQIGRYKKFGNIVQCWITIQLSSATATGNFHINNLPFTTANAGGGLLFAGSVASFQGFTIANQLNCRASSNSTNLFFYDQNTTLQWSSVAGTAEFVVHISYPTSA